MPVSVPQCSTATSHRSTYPRDRSLNAMNLRQTQRALAEVLTACQEMHVNLPMDVFESILSAGEALRHSRVGGKFHIDDAVDEMKQRYGLEAKYKQLEDAIAARKQSQQKRRRLHRADEPRTPRTNRSEHAEQKTPTKQSDSDTDRETSGKKPRTTRQTRTQRIIENNPAKNPANEELADEFVELGEFELEHGETQKGISRMSVAKQLRMSEEPITSGAQARHLPRVGPSAAAKIDEILHRGKMKVLEEYEADSEGGFAPKDTTNQRRGVEQANNKSDEELEDDDEDDEQDEEEDDHNKDEDWHEESE